MAGNRRSEELHHGEHSVWLRPGEIQGKAPEDSCVSVCTRAHECNSRGGSGAEVPGSVSCACDCWDLRPGPLHSLPPSCLSHHGCLDVKMLDASFHIRSFGFQVFVKCTSALLSYVCNIS